MRKPLALAGRAIALLEQLQPLALLSARLFVALAFFISGLTKLRDATPRWRCSPTTTTCRC